MAIPITCTCNFRVNAYNATPAALATAMSVPKPDKGRLNLLGTTILSDTGGVADATAAHRTFVLALNQAPFLPRSDPPFFQKPNTTFSGSVVSTSAQDLGGGLGLAIIKVFFIDVNGNPQNVNVALNGTTPVALGFAAQRITNVTNVAEGAIANFGKIIIYSNTSPIGSPLGNGQGQVVGTMPQPVYQHLVSPMSASASNLVQFYNEWNHLRMQYVLGMPVLWDAPVFA